MFVVMNDEGLFLTFLDKTGEPMWCRSGAHIFRDEPIWVPEGTEVKEVWFRPPFNARFISEWDGGISLGTRCVWDPEERKTTHIETVTLEGVDSLDRQYVIYDGMEIEVDADGVAL